MIQTVQTKTKAQQKLIDDWYTVTKRPFSDRDLQNLASAKNSTFNFGEAEIALSQWGDPQAPLVFLIHGWGGHRAQLASFVPPLLNAGYRVLSFDAPAHGDSPGSQTDGFEIAQVILALVEKIGNPYAVIAHSLGTMATNVALQSKLQPERIVLTGPIRRMSDVLDTFIRMHDLNDDSADVITQDVIDRFGDDVWDITSLDKQLPKLDVPALIIHDRQDDVIPYLSGAAIARAWKSARLFTTKGLGHRLILQSEEVINEVVSFIAS
jgi:pimeloyl-ACP methyl ester carboxylesterase